MHGEDATKKKKKEINKQIFQTCFRKHEDSF